MGITEREGIMGKKKLIENLYEQRCIPITRTKN